MLSFETFNGMTKKELYEIYSNLYREKAQLLEQHHLLKDILSKVTEVHDVVKKTSGDESGHESQDDRPSPTSDQKLKPVRPFPTLAIDDSTENLVLGSSIFARVNTDGFFIPKDVEFHAYSGSTTLEKIEILKSVKSKKLRTVVIQDGTNALSKNPSLSAQKQLHDFCKLFDSVMDKFQPEKIFVCEVPPFRDIERNSAINKRIVEYNAELNTYCTEKGIHIIKLYDSVMKVKNNKDMFFGNVHFSDNIGLPFLVNCVLTPLIHSAYSDGLPRIAKEPATKVSRVNKEQFTTSNTNYSGKKVQYSHNNKFATAKPAFMQRTERPYNYNYNDYNNPEQFVYSNYKPADKYHPYW